MSSAKLFTPLKVGAITATNRVFMGAFDAFAEY